MVKRPNLTNDERTAIYQDLLSEPCNGDLPYGCIENVAAKYKVDRRPISRIWKRGTQSATSIEAFRAARSFKKGKSGRPKKNADEISCALKGTPYRKRRTVRDTAAAIGIAKSTLWDILKRGDMRRTSKSLKPILTSESKLKRVKWVLSHIDPRTRRFSDMYMDVHVDEKWFYLTEKSATFFFGER